MKTKNTKTKTKPTSYRDAKFGPSAHDLAEAFLRWPLPDSVCADLCATRQGPGRVGTNLLSYSEAKKMFEDVLESVK